MDDGEESANRVMNAAINGQDVFGEMSHEASSETEDCSTGQDRVQKHGPTGQAHVQEDGPMDEDQCGPKDHGHVQEDDSTGQRDDQTGQNDVQEDGSVKQLEKSTSRIGDIDTRAPFESVREAVSMFSSIVHWKAHKVRIAERRKQVAQELRKAQEEIPLLKKKSEAAEESKQQVLKELDNAKRRLEELKLIVESAEKEESQAKQDAQLTNLRVEEVEQGIADESSIAAKKQLQVAQARHQAVVSELNTVKLELENLQKEYTSLVSDRDLAIKKAEEAVSSTTETEKDVQDLTFKLITIKEALESAQGAYLEAQETRTEAGLNGEHELKQSEEEWEKMAETEDLESKLDAASVLETELASYMTESHINIQSEADLAKMDLEQVKKNIEITTYEVNDLKLYASSLNSELEQEKATLVDVKQGEWTEAGITAALEADLMRTVSEVTVIEMKERAAQWKTVELPKQLEKASEEVDQAKSRARNIHGELKKAKAAAKKAKKRENKMIKKLNAATRVVEAARASERFALGAISAVEESESARSSESEPESGITLSVEKYQELSQKANKAENEANDRVSEAISQVDIATESEQKAAKKLDEVKSDLVTKKEQLSTTMQKAEKAKEGKLVVEHELRIWRSEHEQRRKAEASRKKKKRSFIPRMCMFLCSKKGRHLKK
ncbi:putative WEB family protein [Helianthus anomalus]